MESIERPPTPCMESESCPDIISEAEMSWDPWRPPDAKVNTWCVARLRGQTVQRSRVNCHSHRVHFSKMAAEATERKPMG
jgi:hypothetical protein